MAMAGTRMNSITLSQILPLGFRFNESVYTLHDFTTLSRAQKGIPQTYIEYFTLLTNTLSP